MKSFFITSAAIDKGPSSNLNIIKAKGDSLYSDSKQFLDLRSGLWNVSLGYNSELIMNIKSQFEIILENKLPYLDINSYNNPVYSAYSSSLLNFMNEGETRGTFTSATYTNSGSEGVEIAVKISQDYARYHGKMNNKIIVFKNSYHGSFFGSMSVSHKFFGLDSAYQTSNNVFVVDPPSNDVELNNIIDLMEANHTDISSIIIEPVLGSGGSITINDKYLETLLSLSNRLNILTVFDEVSTGFLRLGERFSFSQLERKPNIVVLSKSINNGVLPFGAVVIDEFTYSCLEDKNINHFSTQSGNLLCISSAIETLKYFIEYEEEIKLNVQKIESIIRGSSKQYSLDINGRGAMYSIPINDTHKVILIREALKKAGILVYVYENINNTSGITIHPNLLMDLKRLENSVNIIFRKVTEYL